MNLIHSPFFVYSITYSFIFLFALAYYIRYNHKESVVTTSIANALIFLGVAILYIDSNLLTEGVSYWDEIFLYNTAFLFWIPLLISPFVTFYFVSTNNKTPTVVTFWHYLFGYVCTYGLIFVAVVFVTGINEVIANIPNRPQ